jgi:ubiquinone/menaquinone biosynthesis C-methylase UbiE
VGTDDKDATRRWFDRRASGYEGGWTSRWRDPVQRDALAALDLGPGDRLLDVGCGSGWASRTAAASAGSVVGIDLSPGMIRQAGALAVGIGNVRFALADSERLPFADGDFTAVLCSNSFHHYPDPDRAVGEMKRVLAPGGRVVIGDSCSDLLAARIADAFLRRFEPGHVRLYRSTELGAFVQEAGFQRVMLRRLAGGGFAIVRGQA